MKSSGTLTLIYCLITTEECLDANIKDKNQKIPGNSKNARCLIRYKLKTTVLTQSAFTFSESSYFNLKFGIKQFKMGLKSATEGLPKAKILGPADEQTTRFFSKNALI